MSPKIEAAVRAGVSAEVLGSIPASLAMETLWFPFAATEAAISVLVAEPPSEEMMRELEFILRRQVVPHLADRAVILAAIDRPYGPSAYEPPFSGFISTT